LYLAGSEFLRAALRRKGIADHKIAVTGIPVRLSYGQHDSKERLREKLGLAPDTFVVLAMGGGSGIFDKSFIEHLQSGIFPPHLQFIIVCGRNVKLLHRLHEVLGDRDNVMLTGFLEGIHEWMAAADVLITKPGGLTTSEAMALQLPMLLLEPRLGQEQDNADYLIQAGLAYPCRVDHLEDQLQWLIQRPSLLEQMRAKARLSRQQDAARLAVMHIMNRHSETHEGMSSFQKYA
jgi:processive 1,2-diacylglycerol beta-glucosyltransferase